MIENERTRLIQYILNFGQLLEQILHNEDHVEPFVEAGGLDALLKLFPASVSSGFQFLTHVSGVSSPSVSTLHHSSMEESLACAFKCIRFRSSPLKLMKRMIKAATMHLDSLGECCKAQRLSFDLDGIPTLPFYKLFDETSIPVEESCYCAVDNKPSRDCFQSCVST